MGKIFKAGRVVVMTSGRFTGKKGIVVKVSDDGNKRHKFPHLLVLGIARNPKRVHRRISKKKFTQRTTVKPFIKYVNQNHVMPTRYLVNDFDLKAIKEEDLKIVEPNQVKNDKQQKPLNSEKREKLLQQWKKILTKQYVELPNPKNNQKAGNIRFFFQRLRF